MDMRSCLAQSDRKEKRHVRERWARIAATIAVASWVVCTSRAQSISEYIPSRQAEASIDVFAEKRADFRVPRTVYGAFLENIRYSIFGGISAELLDNPSLENYDASLATLKNRFLGNTAFLTSTTMGLPLPWVPLRDEGMRYEPGWGHAANSSRFLYVIGLADREVGIRQEVYLPVDRELDYHGVLFASSAQGPIDLEVSFRKHDMPDSILAKTHAHLPNDERWNKLAFRLSLPKDSVAMFEPVDFAVSFLGNPRISLDEIRLYPDDSVDGMDPDVIKFAKALKIPILRYGGNFSSGYHWRDGIGPVDRRPTKLNQSWGFPEYNEFGTDEFMKFCELIGTRPQICLNMGSGTLQEARDWVEYCQGQRTTPLGALRTANGHPDPYPVAAWEFGNELYGRWQIGWLSPESYAERYAAFYQAIQNLIPPSTALLATAEDRPSQWNDALIARGASRLQYLTIHLIYRMGNPSAPAAEQDSIRANDLALPIYMQHRIARLRAELDGNPATRGRLKLACTEWLFAGQPYVDWNGAIVSNDYPYPRYDNLGGALTAAGWLNILLQNADLIRIADMTGLMEFGGIYKRKAKVYKTPQYWVLWLYSHYAGDIPLGTRTAVREYNAQAPAGSVQEVLNVPYLDVLATLSSDSGDLTLFVVNRNLSDAIPARIQLRDFQAAHDAVVRTVTSGSILTKNDEEHPDALQPKQTQLTVSPSAFTYSFPARSLTVITLKPA